MPLQARSLTMSVNPSSSQTPDFHVLRELTQGAEKHVP